MKKVMLVVVAAALAGSASWAQGILVQRAQGAVSVRHGVTEQWVAIAPGDVLRPEDTMRTGRGSSAVLVTPAGAGAQKRIMLPAEVIVDAADIRDLTPEELMLKLAMEKVRSSPYRSHDELDAPNAGVVHGAEKGSAPASRENDQEDGTRFWNGARVLFDNGFFSTCALKGMELFRLYPETLGSFERRFLVARSLELARLRGEALNEYLAMQGMEGLNADQRAQLGQRIAQVKGSPR